MTDSHAATEEILSAPPRSRWLLDYFRSGWAFFIPYLVAYLLYAWLKWPVNPAPGVEIAQGMSDGATAANSQPSTLSAQHAFIPPLLYVYWFLHLAHLGLGLAALRTCWRRLSHSTLNPQLSTTATPSLIDRLWPLAPWFLLALIFWIPGIYLEWPSDPWEHLRRINEWHILDEVTSHSSWKKSSYFLPYSLTGHLTGLPQISLLNYYYTAVCLLLSWQYFRLGRAVGLSERASFVFVIINALTFGNNIFSFYRYYGLSSSILAQIGAVALTRIALEYFTASVKKRDQATHPNPVSTADISRIVPSLAAFVWAGLTLGPFIVFNHIQGLGIAGLGVLAVTGWRLVEWKRSMILWLAGAAILLSIATVLWFPRHPAIDEIYRPQGWLNAWYGFNLSLPTSPAFERSMQIIGVFGIVNIVLGLWLIWCKNHVAGWLTLMPITALAIPCFSLPFAHALALQTGTGNIITFHRLLFATPSCLALIVAFVCNMRHRSAQSRETSSNIIESKAKLPALSPPKIACVLAAILLLLPCSGPNYNRIFHATLVTPDDLKMSGSREVINSLGFTGTDTSSLSVVMSGFTYRIHSTRLTNETGVELTGYALSGPNPLLAAFEFVENRPPAVFIPSNPTALYTTYSVPGFLSRHWPPQLAAYQQMGNREAGRQAEELGCVRVTTGSLVWYRYRFQPAANN